MLSVADNKRTSLLVSLVEETRRVCSGDDIEEDEVYWPANHRAWSRFLRAVSKMVHCFVRLLQDDFVA